MTSTGKAPLDPGHRTGTPARAARYAQIQRSAAEVPGTREMAMTRRPREEATGERAARFLDIDRRETS